MNPQRPVGKTHHTPLLALLVLLALLTGLAAFPAAAAPTRAACSWNRPGHNPFTGDVAAAVDRYPDIAPAARARLKARMARRDYDEIVTIGRNTIVGRARYGAEIRDMHFGADQVCRTVNRSGWAPSAQERGLVYCEDGQCILVPTVCRNVSRIRRIGQEEPTVAGVSDAKSGRGGGTGGGGGGTAAPAGPTDSRLVSTAQGDTTAATPASAAAPGDALAPVTANGASGASGASDAAGSGFGGAGAAQLGALAPGVSASSSWIVLGGAGLATVAPTASDTRQTASRSPAGGEAGGGLSSGGSVDFGSATLLNPIAPPVPEPGTLALWTTALGVLGWRVRRVRKAQSGGSV